MRCLKCGVVMAESVKFCPDCGAKVISEEELRGPSDISIEWVAEGFRNIGYSIEPDSDDTKKFFARHPDRSNYLVELKTEWPAVTVVSLWGLNPRSRVIRNLGDLVAK